jgi:ATP-dependent Clp protease ATP-binding subunit ClpA
MPTLSTRIDSVTPLDPTTLREARESRDRMLDAQHTLESARADYSHAIRRLHADGGSLREIAQSLGLSHQRVHQIVEGDEGRPARKSRQRRFDWPFTRATRGAKQVVIKARKAAQELGHPQAGTEHLLLALAGAEAESTAAVLAESGLTAEAIRERVAALEPGSSRSRSGFTRAGRRAIEQSLREAQARGDKYIGAEHILLGMLSNESSGAVAIVRELGADPEALASALRAA